VEPDLAQAPGGPLVEQEVVGMGVHDLAYLGELARVEEVVVMNLTIRAMLTWTVPSSLGRARISRAAISK